MPNQNDEKDEDKPSVSYELPLRSQGLSAKGQSSKVMTQAQMAHATLMKSDKQFGNWQKHTTGIGQKLLLQVCWVVKGDQWITLTPSSVMVKLIKASALVSSGSLVRIPPGNANKHDKFLPLAFGKH